MTFGHLARWKRSHLLFYGDDVMMVVVVVVAAAVVFVLVFVVFVVVEFSSLFLFGNYFQINPGLSRYH
jgi:hypothetical protein